MGFVVSFNHITQFVKRHWGKRVGNKGQFKFNVKIRAKQATSAI